MCSYVHSQPTVLDEASRTTGLAESHPGLILVDQSQDFTQGSHSCGTRQDVMHDPLLQGVKKRKVNTPVVVCANRAFLNATFLLP
jgi:hypothetical protein